MTNNSSSTSMQRYRTGSLRNRRPFWLSASSYYMLAAAIALGFFFLIWGILHDGGEDTPWIPAGIAASAILFAAVILREIILRKVRQRYIATLSLDSSLKGVSFKSKDERNTNKLTIEKNAAILRRIKEKSDAAKILGRYADGHREIFELCNEYLAINERELKTVGVGSPRLPALMRGKEITEELHRYHMLQWAEIETRSLTSEAKLKARVNEKIETAQRALDVIDTAAEYYPDNADLGESAAVLREFMATIKVSNLIERAERAAFRGDEQRAKKLFEDALFFLGRDYPEGEQRQHYAALIDTKLDRLDNIDNSGDK